MEYINKTNKMHKKKNQLRLNRIIRQTRTEGFGNRYCIWVQGCSICCPGCANIEMWEKDGGELYSVSEIIREMKMQGEAIEGITILGGEPLEQAEALSELMKGCKKLGHTVILFTGFTYEELMKRKEKQITQILDNTDVLIDGPYIEEKRDFSRPWVGSSNQRYIFLSDRYSVNDLEKQCKRQKFELRIAKNGEIQLNGMGEIEKFLKFLQVRREN